MVVSLYTSRVVLNTLGVEDYGIYGVVGGVVGMLSFLNATMSGATSRFLSVELGKGDSKKLNETFNSALIIHLAISFIVLALAETLGLWFLNEKLVIPDERMFAAHVVYHLSILSTMVGITQVPYNAVIISHEKMDIYAYVELLNVTLKLLIVFLLPILGNDKLIVYAFLVLAVSVFIAIIYRVYCVKNYQETCIKFIIDKKNIYPMLTFSAWDLLGHLGYTIRIQGSNILLNLFFGPVVNAANAIALTVQGVFLSFSTNITSAIRPVIIKSYAQNKLEYFYTLIRECARLSCFISCIITVVVIVHADFILDLWLGKVPEYSVNFVNLCMLLNCITSYSSIIYIGIHACNSVKRSGIYRSILNISVMFVAYCVFSFVPIPDYIYIVILFSQLIILLLDLSILLKAIGRINELRFFLYDLLLCLIGGLTLIFLLRNIFSEFSIVTFFYSTVISFAIFLVLFLITLTKKEKLFLMQYVKKNTRN